jgi:hypothetical protein
LPVPARILVIVTTIITLYSGITGVQDGVAHFAHLGGYAGAWLYLRAIDRKRGEFKRRASKPSKDAVRLLDRWEAIDLTKVHQVNRDEVSRLIERARTNGVRSLTAQEQSYLAMFIPSERPEA